MFPFLSTRRSYSIPFIRSRRKGTLRMVICTILVLALTVPPTVYKGGISAFDYIGLDQAMSLRPSQIEPIHTPNFDARIHLYFSGIIGKWTVGTGQEAPAVAVTWHIDAFTIPNEFWQKDEAVKFEKLISPTPSNFSLFVDESSFLEYFNRDLSATTWNMTLPWQTGWGFRQEQISNLVVASSPFGGFFTDATWQGKFAGRQRNSATATWYPFDEYPFFLAVAAVIPETGRNISISGARVDNPYFNQWTVTINTTRDDTLAQTIIDIYFKRHEIVKIGAFILFSLNWSATLVILIATMAYTFKWSVPRGTDSIVLPFTALFALPAVRSVMPGQPPFGCFIDFAGIIPNLLILAFCACLHILVRLWEDGSSTDPQSSGSEQGEFKDKGYTAVGLPNNRADQP